MASASVHARYPGAQPFADDEASRRVFFGREQLVSQLTNQILGTRLLVVYAKSGQGKTSLLRAGVSPRLRDEGYLPLHVRVNDVQRGPLPALFEGVLSEAQRQGIECSPGTPTTLWSFFKTVEFWRGDLLLTPVLILDQFEELFTLQKQESRKAFLDQLGFLVRGVCPPGEDAHVSPKAPALRVVLSLREDYLGLLEEAANHIPQILDHRFRLSPLSVESAQRAMIGPAELEDPSLASPAFEYEPAALELITTYLSRRKLRGVAQRARYVEPFQLQLVCQSVERQVSARPSAARQRVSVQDIGGRRGLETTLASFYSDTLRELPRRAERARVAELCQRHLIGADGRRLSLDEAAIERHGVSRELLLRLVGRRLLRTEVRAGNVYYELSHDALIEPVLAAQRRGAMLSGWLQVGLAWVAFSALVYFGVKMLEYSWDAGLDQNRKGAAVIRYTLVLIAALALFASRYTLRWFDGGVSRLRRFAQRGDAALGRVTRESRRRGVALIALALSTLCVAAYHLAVTLTLLYEVRYGDGASWFFINPQHWDLVRRHGITAMGVDGFGWLAFDLLAPTFALTWCRAGLRSLVQGDGAGAQGGPARALERRPFGHLLLAALSGLTALPLVAEQALMIRCKFSGGTLPAGFPGDWYWNLKLDCATCVDNPNYVAGMLPHLTAPGLLLFAVFYFLRPRPAAVAHQPAEAAIS